MNTLPLEVQKSPLALLPMKHRSDIWLRAWSGVSMPRALDIIGAKDLSRRARCERDLMAFKETYFSHIAWDPSLFHKESTQHKQAATLLRSVTVHKEAEAAPRSLGKTTECRLWAIWCICYRWFDFVVFLGSKAPKGEEHIKNIKKEFLTNELLHEDFPELCGWVRSFGGDPRRCKMTYPDAEWSDSELCFNNGSWICGYGMDSSLPGMNKTGGKRPKLLIFDDIETVSSVRSKTETAALDQRFRYEAGKLHDINHRAIYWYVCTVRALDCISDCVTDPKREPEWRGRRYRALIKPPDNEELWEYFINSCLPEEKGGRPIVEGLASIEETCRSLESWLTSDDCPNALDALEGLTEGHRAALRYYVANKAAMDAGAELLDNVRLPIHVYYHSVATDGEDVVACELQNDPPKNAAESKIQLETDYLLRRCIGEDRGVVPDFVAVLTATIDIGAHALHWQVDGMDAALQTSALIDQGIEQTDLNAGGEFKMTDDERIRQVMVERAILKTLERLKLRFASGYAKKNGEILIPRLVGVDCGGTAEVWAWYETILRFCAKSPVWIPLKGEKWHKSVADRASGRNWICEVTGNPGRRHDCNADHYKLRVIDALTAPARDEKGLIVSGSRIFHAKTPLIYCKHMTAERWITSISEDAPSGKEIKVGWNRDGSKPNHWFDASWMHYALADILKFQGWGGRKAPQRPAPPVNPGREIRRSY